ncbi:uncharacterized protein [Parasteatoda tepidariorum]|uniref:uncharacterized protein n=1 Tax=Parasteatoda tepidariorum TaxID=114398 RepID=UPI001C71AC32|nr:sperm mitochondrial-associated cysteine-rich protein-like isoform X2 [Parasteatoda tepidariorum]
MYRVIIMALFLNKAMAIVHPVCDFACTSEIMDSCPVLDCGPNESPQRNPNQCGCCNECLPNKQSDDCNIDCSKRHSCPRIPAKCPDGEELVTPKCSCCPSCQKIKGCQTDCSGRYNCPRIPAKCPHGEKLVTPKCSCCPKCEKVEDSDTCEDSDSDED